MDRVDTRILILAAGPSKQWTHRSCRHLLPIEGEPLILRTRRLCEELGHPAMVVTDDPRVQQVAQRYFAPGPNRWVYDTMRNTRELWAERTIFLAGDVLFYKETLQKILNSEGTCLWDGCYGILAIVLDQEDWEPVSDWLAQAWNEAERRGHGELQILQGNIVKCFHDWRKDLYDFDKPAVYEKCLVDDPWTWKRKDRQREKPAMILILAAGTLRMWQGDCPRHLVEIAGEPLLARTLRELREQGREATIVTDNPEILETIPGCFEPEKTDVIWHTMLSTRELWEGKVLVMLGDVFYRDDMYDLMFNYGGQTLICFDSFACLWDEEDYDDVVEILEELEERRPYNLLWREGHFLKIPCKGHTDFDVVAYYEQFLEANPWAQEAE